MNEARSWLYNTIISRLQQTAGGQFTVVVSARERPITVTRLLEDGSRLDVELSWVYDAPRVVWAEIIFPLGGEDSSFRLPADLIRIAAAREPARRDATPDE